VAEPQSKTKKDDKKESGENREEPPPAGNDEQAKAPSVIRTHRSEVPTDVAALTKFLETKEVVFQKKMNDVNKARDCPTKLAHVRIDAIERSPAAMKDMPIGVNTESSTDLPVSLAVHPATLYAMNVGNSGIRNVTRQLMIASLEKRKDKSV
jgi:hypothetical protein